jgi:hypothetical protein
MTPKVHHWGMLRFGIPSGNRDVPEEGHWVVRIVIERVVVHWGAYTSAYRLDARRAGHNLAAIEAAMFDYQAVTVPQGQGWSC